jgi:hypothetical protein
MSDITDFTRRKIPEVAPSGLPSTTGTMGLGNLTDFSRPPLTHTQQELQRQKKLSWGEYFDEPGRDALRGTGQMFSAGQAPRAEAARRMVMEGTPYGQGVAEELRDNERARERSPLAWQAGEIAGGAAGGVVMGGLSKVLGIGRGIANAFGAGPKARAAGYGTEAGLQGATQGAGHTYSGNPEDYATNAAKGFATAAPLGAVAGAAVTPRSAVVPRPGDPRTGQPIEPPTLARQQEITNRGYRMLENNPARYSRAEFNRMLDVTEQQMAANGALPATAAGPHAILERLRAGGYSGVQPNGQRVAWVSPQEITLARQALTGMRNTTSTGARDGIGANALRNNLDDFLQNPGSAVVANHADALRAGQIAGKLRREYAAMSRSREMTEDLTNARMVEGTGGPQVRGQLQAAGREKLKEEAGQFPNLQGHTAAERARLAEAITPNPVGAATGRAIQMLPGLENAGKRVEALAGRGIERRWEEAAQALRERGPLYEQRIQGSVPVPGPGMTPATQAAVGAGVAELATPPDDGREALVPAMLRQGLNY